jgi:hypothetical protein
MDRRHILALAAAPMLAIGIERGQGAPQETLDPGADEGFEGLRVGAAHDIPESGAHREFGAGKAQWGTKLVPMIAGLDPAAAQAGLAVEQTQHQQSQQPGMGVAWACAAARVGQGVQMGQ